MSIQLTGITYLLEYHCNKSMKKDQDAIVVHTLIS